MSPVSVKLSTRESNSEASKESSLPLEIDDADEIDLQVQDRHVVGRHRQPQHPGDGEGGPRDLEDDAELEADQGRRAPAELAHRPDQEAPRHRREDALEVGDDAGRIGDDVDGEEDRVQRAVAHAEAQHVEQDRAVDADAARRRRSA